MDVLLFDCRKDQLVMMEEILTRIGCKVSLVMKEYECFSKLIGRKCDLVIFDHSIPGLNITDFVTQIERIDLCISVAMMVTLPSRFYEEKYGCSGIDFLIFKPFGYNEILFLVRSAFQYSLKLRKAS
ncbi:MAG: response regulator [Flavobacteriaceae bacterium]|nr:MAG: response regulator [Flavobacteriaceae bacterium]